MAKVTYIYTGKQLIEGKEHSIPCYYEQYNPSTIGNWALDIRYIGVNIVPTLKLVHSY